VSVDELGADLLSISAHKVYGPKGVGALWVRRREPRVRLAPLFHGGGHERGLRSGTPNVPGAVGLGLALEIAAAELEAESRRVHALRDRLHRGILDGLDGVTLNGHPERRVAGNLNLSFAGVPGESLVSELRLVAVSTGSACTSADPQPSHVLSALGVDREAVHSSLRFGIGRFTTEEEIDLATAEVVRAVRHLRELAPPSPGAR
jgi:cysteine desulfurase